MRARVGVGASLAALALVGAAACSFGVNLDGVFGAGPDDGGPGDGSVDGGVEGGPAEAGIPSVQVVQLAMGASNFGCGRRVDGTVMCWGADSSHGELGDGLGTSSSTPVLVKDLNDAVDVSVGNGHACIVHKAGGVSCWGNNGTRQLGEGTTNDSPTPKPVLQLTTAQRVVCGGGFSCALLEDGTVQCWGDNTSGQLGDGTVTPRSQPAPVTGIAQATQVVATDGSACALVKSGDVYCWGRDDVGQTSTTPPTNLTSAAKVAGLSGVASLGAGGSANHFCAVLATGEARCWGAGSNGNLGNAKTNDSAMPVPVLGVSDAAGITTGGAYSCVWRKSGAVGCWGANDWKQLGLGDSAPTDSTSSPLPVVGLTDVTQMALGSAHACALLAGGTKISCWGTNVGHALGRGTRVASPLPVKVAGPGGYADFGMGDRHTCAIDAQGGVSCWGDNELRQLSVTTFRATGTPSAVPGLGGATRVTGGQGTSCAVLSGGAAMCWGLGQSGQLGNGMNPYIQDKPVTFGGPTPKTDIGEGYGFTCALVGSKDVACAGDNGGMRLGNGGSGTSSPVLVPAFPVADAGPEAGVPSLGATRLSVGPGHSCIIRAGGVVSCWGFSGGGECGVAKTYATAPVDVSLPLPAIDVAAGGSFTCALLQDGSVRCFGYNSHGQVTGGDPDGPGQRTPALGGKKGKAIVAGDDHACALLDDGSVVCWGKGTSGQLGSGVYADATTPSAVKGLAGVKVLAAGGSRTCATLTDNSVYCWGDNRSGELGDGVVMTTGAAGPVVGY